MKVSVIIPIYNVAAYIARCVRSLLGQTLDDVEFIFVDDCSSDDSIFILEAVIKEFPKRAETIKLIRHSQNMGLPAARNSGLEMAEGEYIFHCDSDDWLESTALENLYYVAQQKNADFVWCDWYLAFPQSRRLMKQPDYYTPQEALRGMLAGIMKYNVWNKLIKKELYIKNGILFPDGHGMGEDMTIICLLACAKQVAYVPKALYNYVKREGEAFTNSWSKKHLDDLFFNTYITIDFLKKVVNLNIQEEIAWFKLNVKYPFLISKDYALYELWQQHFTDAHGYIWTNSYVSLRSKILQTVAFHRQYWLLYLHYQLVYKFIYGVMYK